MLEQSAFRKRSVARLGREARSERFSIDFRVVRASADMRKTYKNNSFLQVFTMSPLLRTGRPARAEKHRKNTKIDPPKHSKSTQDRPKSLFGAFFEPLESTKSVEIGSSSDLESTWSVETAFRSDCRGDLGRSWLGRGVRRGSQVGLGGAPLPGPLRVIRIGIYGHRCAENP